RYVDGEVEPRWQRFWHEHATFRAVRRPGREKRYVLDMFPYPSAAGLHVGHPEGYTATDIVCRHLRMRGYDVLHPMGWDAFGLPAEQHAIRTGTHPTATTRENVATFKRQLKMLRFTAYTDRLAEDLKLVDWPDGTLTAQRRWIGRSEGVDVHFAVADHADADIGVFTTRPDTLMGVTYVVLAPEHTLVSKVTTS